jgi:hypothetical protein
VPEFLVPMVEAVSVNSQQPLHPVHQIASGRFAHQMEMVAHQAPGVHLPVGLLTRLGQRIQE